MIEDLRSSSRSSRWPAEFAPDYGSETLRFWIEGEYVVLYDPSKDPLRILAILHGARDYASLSDQASLQDYELDTPDEDAKIPTNTPAPSPPPTTSARSTPTAPTARHHPRLRPRQLRRAGRSTPPPSPTPTSPAGRSPPSKATPASSSSAPSAAVSVAVMQGRVHAYEGYSMAEVTFPTRVLGLLGCTALIVTNAAGGINTSYGEGTLVAISDHINLTGTNAALGPNEPRFGLRPTQPATASST